jgi:chemotaxis methyl-accepting protein methylase/signal transduction histidine kinase
MMGTTLQNSKQNTPFFPVAGIAAGLGGLQAIIKVLSHLPENAEMALVIIFETSPEYPESLPESLSQYTKIPVSEIIHTVHFTPNHIYIIPQESNLIVQDGDLALHQRTRIDKAEERFDLFFASLARVYNSAAVGIILSGSGFHGVEGFKSLSEIGAATIVQDPRTAGVRELPQSIISAGLADYVQAPYHIGQLLGKLSLCFANAVPHKEDAATEKESYELTGTILDILRMRTGVDFTQYNVHIVRRRIAYRMVSADKNSLNDYYAYIRHHGKEQDMLFDSLLIPVTGFFRDAGFYDSLTSAVLPYLVQNSINNSLRIWIPGCASGEQAYSVAISLHEFLIRSDNEQMQVEIFASDISVPGITKARRGIYSEQDIYQISGTRLQHYFTKTNDGYRVCDVIRNMCIFTVHDLVKGPALSEIDLVCCSNVLHYFNESNQNLALSALQYSLREKGLLCLGTSERLNVQNLFKNFGSGINVYSNNYTRSSTAIVTPEEGELKRNKFLDRYIRELESKNVELQLLKNELSDRQGQLSASSDLTQTIIQTMQEPLVLMDKYLIVKSANPAFYKYFSTVQNKTVGYSFLEIGNCQWDIAEFKEQINSVLRDKTVLENFRVETQCEGSGKKTMNVSARMLLGPNPQGLLLLSMQDITEADSAYELYEDKNYELQKYNEVLQTFTTAATTNILDPLQKILMLGKRIFDKEINLSEHGNHNLRRIVFSAENLTKLMEDLILYSKITFLAKEYKRADLNLIVKKALAVLKNSINQKKAVIKVAPLPQLNVIPGQMHQLFANIISNAVQYSREDIIPEIYIDAKEPSVQEIIKLGGNPEMSFVKITITDNGIGFYKQYETQIFDPFFRLHGNVQYFGSGLGLTLVKKIVSNHQGFVSASSKMQEGTNISIYLPAKWPL